ncbi:MAG: hypothetical protein LBE67_07700 [Kocuria palustris]|nr:hypothetical protein [Kocuria palustris]
MPLTAYARGVRGCGRTERPCPQPEGPSDEKRPQTGGSAGAVGAGRRESG